jgi:uncharacterized membrane protein YphA (DoxX/SURF4 family)
MSKPMPENKKRRIIDGICCLFIILFLYASLNKLLDFQKFKIQLAKSPLLTAFSGWVTWLVPSIEILVVILLLIKRFQLIGLFAAYYLMVLFSIYIIAILNFSGYIPCSCGGVLQNMSWMQHLIFNSAFVALAIVAVLIFPDENNDLLRNKGGSRKPKE